MAPDTGVEVAPSAIWEGIDLSQMPERSGCCSPFARLPDGAGSGDLMWNDIAHRLIVIHAVDLMREHVNSNDNARRFVGLYDASQDFEKAIDRGLKAADYDDPWRGLWIPIPFMNVYTWHGHFYDPDTGRNYLGAGWNAVDYGAEHFRLSVEWALKGHYAQAGFDLGLSLHFLTDLLQPMHSANFTNVFGHGYPLPNVFDKRHSWFEELTDKHVEAYLRASRTSLRPEHLEIGDIKDARWFLHETAVNMKRTFLGSPMQTVLRGWGGVSDPWTYENALSVWKDSLALGPRCVARYLAYWSSVVKG